MQKISVLLITLSFLCWDAVAKPTGSAYQCTKPNDSRKCPKKPIKIQKKVLSLSDPESIIIKRIARERKRPVRVLSDAQLRSGNLRDAQLQNADLQGAYLAGVDFSWADLTGADMYGAYLRDADFVGTTLDEANLIRADLQGANLFNAYFWEADLRDADFRGANLRRADLRGANLRRADLRGANLAYADFRGAILRWAMVTKEQADYLKSQGYSGSVFVESAGRLLPIGI